MGELKEKNIGPLGLLSIAVLFVASSHLALAQVSASVSGRIEDSSGAMIPGVTVTVTSLERGAARTVTAHEAGNYRVLSLPQEAQYILLSTSLHKFGYVFSRR